MVVYVGPSGFGSLTDTGFLHAQTEVGENPLPLKTKASFHERRRKERARASEGGRDAEPRHIRATGRQRVPDKEIERLSVRCKDR